MSTVGFPSFGPIGSTGATPLPQSLLGSPGRSFAPQPIARQPAVDATDTTAAASPASAPSATTAAVPSAPATAARAAPGGGAHGGGGVAAASAATAAITVDALISGYSTTVGGKQYAASILETGGEYTASIANVPGATATGTTEQAAENNLNIRIDELV